MSFLFHVCYSRLTLSVFIFVQAMVGMSLKKQIIIISFNEGVLQEEL